MSFQYGPPKFMRKTSYSRNPVFYPNNGENNDMALKIEEESDESTANDSIADDKSNPEPAA